MDYSVGIPRPGPEAAGSRRGDANNDPDALHENMVICVEALVGREGGRESVELEEQLSKRCLRMRQDGTVRRC